MAITGADRAEMPDSACRNARLTFMIAGSVHHATKGGRICARPLIN
ncbi:MAG: hypothetical protein QOH17_4290, partial [Pseudonocardiales bacterium]|nr:hypothetical protein [Pseudonocardiales bacterium]